MATRRRFLEFVEVDIGSNHRILNRAKHKCSDFRPWSSSSIILRKRVKESPYLCDPHYVSYPNSLSSPHA